MLELQEYGLTIDDDSYYEDNLIENLYNAYLNNPKNIYSRRVVKLKFEDDVVKSISPRKYLYKDDFKPAYLNQLIGQSGVLYPPDSLHKDVLNVDLFKKIMPTHNDVYFWAMALKTEHKNIWAKYKGFLKNDNFMICTDYPQ